ncbi:MAG: cheW40H, partial [Myxococcales bacterium]|nr:cheW40H [Myxococcales bacterium]
MTKELVFATEETYLRRDVDRRAQSRRGVLTVGIGGEVYGVEILSIREIIKLREITEVPRAPRFLLGVVTVRGLVLPVVDLRLRLR